MRIKKNSINVLKEFIKENNIKNISNKFNVPYMKIRDNYFKFFKRYDYIKRTKRGFYIITEKGKDKIKKFYLYPKVEDFLIKSVNKKLDNISILKELKNKFNFRTTNFGLFAMVSRLRKKYDVKLRNKNEVIIPNKIDEKLAELIGLIMSDGYISKYQVSFSNKNNSLINRFKELFISIFKTNNYYIRDTQIKDAKEINFNSLDVATYLSKLLNKKNNLPNELINSNDKIKKVFLKGMFSGDGAIILSIPYYKAYSRHSFISFLFLGCRKINLTKQIEDILISFGFKVNSNNRGLKIMKKKSIIKFNKEIGFINNCFISSKSKKWQGFTKNQLLNFVVNDLFNKDNRKYYYSLSKQDKSFIIGEIRAKISKYKD